MKKLGIFCISILGMSMAGMAQKTADFSKIDDKQPVDGFFFYLPRTAVEFEFTITENIFSKGELSGYAEQYFQTKPEISENRSVFSISNISIKPYAIPDPNQKYRYSAETAGKIHIQTLAGGIIKSINAEQNTNTESVSPGIFSRFSGADEVSDAKIPFFSLGTRSDTILNREITADSTIIERRVINRRTISNTPEEMARESIKKLDDIRHVRYMLISGPEDIVMDGKSLEISLKELEKTEQDLLALFFGKTNKINRTYRFAYIPAESPDTLFYLSKEKGVNTGESSGYAPVKISVNSFGNSVEIPNSAAEANGVIPYRVPAKMVISVVWNGSKYFETELYLPQYGKVVNVPMKNPGSLRVIYDEMSGSIKEIGPATPSK